MAQLRAFEAAARHLSFRRAADELRVTQTAISHQIRQLEQFVGGALFRRRPRPLTLTDAGAQLFPTVRNGLDAFEASIAGLGKKRQTQSLRVTTTNSFASRWLVPRIASFRKTYPRIALECIGTDAVLDLDAGEADLAIRYMHAPPKSALSEELFRDTFISVCSPKLLRKGAAPITDPMELKGLTLIDCYWSPTDPHAPTWARWLEWLRKKRLSAPALSELELLTFREELHGIDAAIAGQGVVIISDALVAHELKIGALVKAMAFEAPGYGFYLVPGPNAAKRTAIEAFSSWARSAKTISVGSSAQEPLKRPTAARRSRSVARAIQTKSSN